MQDKDSLSLIVHPRDQAVFIPSDVENGPAPHQIGVVVHRFHLCRRLPIRLAHYRVPGFKAGLRVGVLLKELYQRASFYDAHASLGSHNENKKSSGT